MTMKTPNPPMPLRPASRGEAPGRGRLEGKRILVVGGGQRIFTSEEEDPIGNGRAICRVLAREGARVAVADARLDSAEVTLRHVRADGSDGITVQADVTSEDDISRMFDQTMASFGGLDGVVYNVGIGGHLGLDVSMAEWDRIIGVNLRGALLAGRAALDVLDPGGSIVLISSTAGYRAGSRMIAYDASKAALVPLMRQLAISGGKKDIRCNIVIPGLVDTPIGRAAVTARPSRGRGENLLFRRQATAWEIAYATLFFMSDESAFVTAQQLAVDSGQTGL